MSDTPLVSVILTTFNRRTLLSYAIESVLNQTYQNFELIVINDYGEDVWDIIKSFHSDKIRYISHIKNLGISSARNTAIQVIRGDLVCYLDDDDLFLPEHLQVLIQAMKKDDKLFAYSDASFVNEIIQGTQRNVINRSSQFEENYFSMHRLLIKNYIPINTWIHDVKLLDLVGGFDESLNSHEDWDMLLRLVNTTDIMHVKYKTVEVRNRCMNPDNRSFNTQSRWYEDFQKIYKRYPSNDICILKKRQQKIHLLIRERMNISTGIRKISTYIFYMKEKFKLRFLQLVFLYKYKCWDKEC